MNIFQLIGSFSRSVYFRYRALLDEIRRVLSAYWIL